MIKGDRVQLRAVDKDDLTRFVGWLNDPEVRQGMSLFLPLSLSEEEQWFEAMLKRPPEEHPLMIEIDVQGEWIPAGNCGLFNIDWRVRAAEIGIFIGEKQYWNQGYGTEVMKLLLRHGFDTLNLNRLFLRVFENNPRAICAYEKAGFIPEGCMRAAHYYQGQYVDVQIMAVLRSEWQET
jgi:RimJ/RimL family protein N-acetyltransferase